MLVATRELNVAFPEDLFFTPSVSTVFALSSQPFSLSFSRVRTRHIYVSLTLLFDPPFRENSRRFLAWVTSSSVPLSAHLSSPFLQPSAQIVSSVKIPLVCSPLEDRPCLGYAALVVSLPTLLSLLLAWPGRRFLSVAALRGSTTTEKRTALFV